MKSDLRNLVASEEAYFADSLKYGWNVACAPDSWGVIFCPTTGNRLIGPTLTGQGWSATIGAVPPAAEAMANHLDLALLQLEAAEVGPYVLLSIELSPQLQDACDLPTIVSTVSPDSDGAKN